LEQPVFRCYCGHPAWGRRMKAPTTENHSDEGSYSSKKHEISEADTALCLGFKSSVSKAIDQVVESPNNTLH